MMAEDTTGSRRNCKRVHLQAAMGHEEAEDMYYLNKIVKLVQQKMKLIDVLPKKLVEERKKPKRDPTHVQKNKKMEIVSNKVTRELKEFITKEMKGKEAKVVIQKTLYKSDLEKEQNRLNMPIRQLETRDFLRENEERDLKNGMELEVGLLGPRLKMHEKPMVLKMWHMNSTSNYVLITNWNNFVLANKKDLQKGKKIQVWSFRRDEQLCFAIACLERVDDV